MPTPNGAIPVEALLRISLDKAGAQGVRDFLDQQEQSFTRIERLGARLSSHFGGLTREAMGLAGVAGVGAVISKLIGTDTSGALVGLASGRVTGGAGVGWGYGGALLSAQGKTGVAADQIAQGLIQAVQQVGGHPTPGQAAVLGGLLAGYGQTVGLSPAQVAGVVAPLLQASNKPLTAGSLLSLDATLSQGLTNFPGSQSAPMLGLLSQLGVAQALGIGPAGGFTPNVGGLAAAVNAAAGANSIWRNPSITSGAISAISGGLQNAYGNPAMEAFLQRSGISYQAQRQGFTPQNMLAIMHGATGMYGTGVTRDLALRSMFGLQGADLLETFTPGSHASQALEWALKNPHHPDSQALLNQINHAQLGHTPQSELSKIEARILGLIHQHPLAAGAGALGVRSLLKRGGLVRKGLSKGLGKLRGPRGGVGGDPSTPDSWGEADGSTGAGAGEGADMAAEGLIAKVLGSTALKILGPIGWAVGFGLDAPNAGLSYSDASYQHQAVRQVLMQGIKKFGSKGIHSSAARNWMEQQLYSRNQGTEYGLYGISGIDQFSGRGGPAYHERAGAGKLLDQVLGVHPGGSTLLGGRQPVDVFSEASKALLQAAQDLQSITRRSGPGFASYTPSPLGVGGVQALGALAPGIEFASLVTGGSAGHSNRTAFTDFAGLNLSTTSPGSPGAPTGSGGPAGQVGPRNAKQVIAAAAAKYGVPFQILWGVYGAESGFGTAYKNGGQTFGFFGLTSKGLWRSGMSFQQDAETAAQLLAKLYKDNGGDWNKALMAYSGSNYGLSHVQGLAGNAQPPASSPAAPSSTPTPGTVLAAADHSAVLASAHLAAAGGAGHPHRQPIHVHVHLDGREMRNHRVLLGHHR